MTRKTAQEVIEANKKLLADHPELKTWDDIHAFTIKSRLAESRGIKCIICTKRDESANNGGKFTCESCRNFLISQNVYYIAGETESLILENFDDYTMRMRDVLDMPRIGRV